MKALARLQKKVVENHNINILTVNAINGYKPNKDVLIKICIAPNPDNQKLGDYLALSAVDIDKEKYSYDQSSDIIYWKIGNMDSYETQTCNILLEAEEIGHNTIYVCAFDYLNPDKETIIETELELEADDSKQYYVDDIIPVKAILKAKSGTKQDIFGEIWFTATDEETETMSQAQISRFNNDYYALTHIRPKSTNPLTVIAKYEGAQMLSTEYTASKSKNTLTFDNIQKYDTVIELRTEKESYTTKENIQVIAKVLYNNGEEQYFDKALDIKFFIEGYEFKNITYENKEYVVNFLIKHADTYKIQAFIPNTYKTEEHFAEIEVNVIDDGENNE